MIRSGIVTLTTDFGVDSSYAGSLRGVLLSNFRGVTLADITHAVRPYDLVAGALTLHAAAPRFPRGTVHLAVVDPGVGSTRRPLIVSWKDDFLVGPDNGLFTPFYDGCERLWEIEPLRVASGRLCPTFHGRDLFAPVAARLAAGARPEEFGEPCSDPVRLEWLTAIPGPRGLEVPIIHVDSFGNLITSLAATELPAPPEEVLVEVAGRVLRGLCRTYSESPPGEWLALIGSTGLLEVAVAQGSAAAASGLGVGARLLVRPDSSGGE